jgi:hypothetical protein
MRGLVAVITGAGLVFMAPTHAKSATASDHPLVQLTKQAPRPDLSSGRAVLDRYCVTCHNKRAKVAGLELDVVDIGQVDQSADVWERVVRKLRAGVMPPAGQPRPDAATLQALASDIELKLDRAAVDHPNPGRTESFHRLNRAEYRNAVRDLFAMDVDTTSLLPSDDASYGFDNIAGVLKLNQALVERYLSAARQISRSAVGAAPPSPVTEMFRVSPELPQYKRIEGLPFGTRGGTLIHYNFPVNGEFEFNVALLCTTEVDINCNGSIGFSEPYRLAIMIDGVPVKIFTIEPRRLDLGDKHAPVNPTGWDQGFRFRVPVKAGPRAVGVTFINESPDREEVRVGYRKRFERPFRYYADVMAITKPFVDNVSISGPFSVDAPGDTPSRRAIFVCHPTIASVEASCARTILSTLAKRAYRRPVTSRDVGDLLTFYDEERAAGGLFEGGIQAAIGALLVSPDFLFRIERDPSHIAPDTNYHVSDLELASRLSFFLWSSIPDDELMELAVSGRLRGPNVLARQVRRMLADHRSHALTENFAGQWLKLRNVEIQRPNDDLFPDFDDGLRQALRRETELFFDSIVQEDRSVLDLLTANYTFVNERLAEHYGIPGVKGTRFRRVPLSDDSPRRGLLGQGSLLMVTSYANRTSPVLRGKWILENILGTPPPPPPPNVPALKEGEEVGKALSMRERMAQHRANPVCSSCHSVIDPVGFALENFDAIGRWRDVDEGLRPIDSAGVLPDGTKFNNLTAFRSALEHHPERFVAVLTEKLLTYALGRGLEYYDMPALRKITQAHDHRFSSLVLDIVNSVPFQMRRSPSADATDLSAARR